MIKHVNSQNFENEVLNKDKLVVVDFFATWCGPCKMLTPELETVSESRADFDIVKVDIDEAEDLAIKYNVAVVPTLIMFKDGKEVDRVSGFMTGEVLTSRVEELL